MASIEHNSPALDADRRAAIPPAPLAVRLPAVPYLGPETAPAPETKPAPAPAKPKTTPHREEPAPTTPFTPPDPSKPSPAPKPNCDPAHPRRVCQHPIPEQGK